MFFFTAAPDGGRQIRRVGQHHAQGRWRRQLADRLQERALDMQATMDLQPLAKDRKHIGGRRGLIRSQPTETPPIDIMGQLPADAIERIQPLDQRQQMNANQLAGGQALPLALMGAGTLRPLFVNPAVRQNIGETAKFGIMRLVVADVFHRDTWLGGCKSLPPPLPRFV
jgi:hypothetical protein